MVYEKQKQNLINNIILYFMITKQLWFTMTEETSKYNRTIVIISDYYIIYNYMDDLLSEFYKSTRVKRNTFLYLKR